MIPLLPAVVVGVVVAGAATIAVLRSRESGTVTAAQVGLAPGTATSGTMTQALLGTQQVTLLTGKAATPKPPPIPKRIPKQTEAERLAAFKYRWYPAYMKDDGCKKFYWGFNALQVAQDAAAYGGAGFVSGLIDWIKLAVPKITVITDAINFKFRFKLERFDLAALDADGWMQEIGSNIYRIDAWTDSKHDPPFSPLPEVKGWTRVWISKEEGGQYMPDDKTITIIRPILGNVYAGMPTWQWSWFTYQKNIRKLFRQDQINISLLASRKRAACGDMRWWMVTNNAASKIYK